MSQGNIMPGNEYKDSNPTLSCGFLDRHRDTTDCEKSVNKMHANILGTMGRAVVMAYSAAWSSSSEQGGE